MYRRKIDLNTCEKGDILISSHGLEMEYVGKTPLNGMSYLDHVVKYPAEEPYGKESFGTRTNDGYVFAKNRKPETDHNVVYIIEKNLSSYPSMGILPEFLEERSGKIYTNTIEDAEVTDDWVAFKLNKI